MISEIKTPAEYIEKKQGLDYVALAYMRHIANEYYPGWNWQILNCDIVQTNGKLLFASVHGRLTWVEPKSGLSRIGDMVAAHRIQYTGDKLLDPGNDIKAANTDTMKKAFNLYLNISDDVYKFEGPELSDENKSKLSKLIERVDSEKIRKQNAELYGVNNRNLVDTIIRLRNEESKSKPK